MSKLGYNIKIRREQLGISQEELAARMGYRSRSTIAKIESGENDVSQAKLHAFADALQTTTLALMGLETEEAPPRRGRKIPIIGSVPAGLPAYAYEDIEGYEYADVPSGADYFFLRVRGTSMINAHIYDGSLVLVRRQSTAENGQIVVCLVNGEEATLKRFKRQGDIVLLLPENPEFEPRIVPLRDFESGEAAILGVAVEVKTRL